MPTLFPADTRSFPTVLFPSVEWEIRYLCLSRADMMQIQKLPDDDQTPYGFDIVLEQSARGIGHELNRVSNEARWRTNPELALEPEESAAEVADTFGATAANMP